MPVNLLLIHWEYVFFFTLLVAANLETFAKSLEGLASGAVFREMCNLGIIVTVWPRVYVCCAAILEIAQLDRLCKVSVFCIICVPHYF